MLFLTDLLLQMHIISSTLTLLCCVSPLFSKFPFSVHGVSVSLSLAGSPALAGRKSGLKAWQRQDAS